MVRELFLAIILGAVLGFGITGGLVTLNKRNRTQPKPAVTTNNSLTPTPLSATPIIQATITPEPSLLTIDSPENETITQTSQVTIKGQTIPQSTVIIAAPLKIYTVTADQSGAFTAEIDLETGVNIVQINSTNPDNTQTEKELIITYSTAKI